MRSALSKRPKLVMPMFADWSPIDLGNDSTEVGKNQDAWKGTQQVDHVP